MKNTIVIAGIMIAIGAGAGFAYLKFGKTTSPLPTPTISVHDTSDGHDHDAPDGHGHHAADGHGHVPGHEPAGEWCAGHQIAETDCPWCMPSLIESRGFCDAHDVAEALCTVCNPALVAGFKAENDWCAGHNVPESQCAQCLAGNLPPGERGNR